MLRLLASAALAAVVGTVAAAAEVDPVTGLAWPTPNPAGAQGGAYVDFVQPTQSGRVESGMFGCVRSERQQFHEGLDLRPVQRDARGEPADSVFAMWPGTVRYVNASAGASNYGRYIVIEHRDEDGLAFVSLYAHLQAIAEGIGPDTAVTAGQVIGVMGRSANSPIPRERAHVHVETGFWLSNRFQRWYDARGFQHENVHGVFNGMNIAGFDFLDYVERRRRGEVVSIRDYVTRLPVAVTVLVRSTRLPDFVERHPGLVTAAPPAGRIVAWQIDFTWHGLPRAWRPLGAGDPAVRNAAGREIIFANPELLARFPCQRMVRQRNGEYVIGPKLQETLDILFAGL